MESIRDRINGARPALLILASLSAACCLTLVSFALFAPSASAQAAAPEESAEEEEAAATTDAAATPEAGAAEGEAGAGGEGGAEGETGAEGEGDAAGMAAPLEEEPVEEMEPPQPEPELEPQQEPEPEPEPITEPEEPPSESSPPTLLVSALVGAFIPQVFNRLDASFLVSIGVGYVLPFLDYRLAVVVDGFYSRPERSQTIDDPRLTAGQYSYTLIQNNASVFVGAHYHFMSLTDDMFVPYVGLGVRVHFLHSEIDGMANAEALGYHTEFSVKAGGALRGGLGVHLGPGMITAEVELALAPIDHLVTGDENVGDLSIAAGYRFIF